MLPQTDEFWADYEYIQKYGEKKLMLEFITYEIITGKNWGDALASSQSMEKFHKEVILPLLLKNEDVKKRLINDFIYWLEDESTDDSNCIIYSIKDDAPQSAKDAYKKFSEKEHYLCELKQSA